MAAVLCQSIGKILTAPCRLIGCTCNKVFGICKSPFCCYATVTAALNVPPIILFGLQASFLGDECRASIWLAVNALFCVFHLIGSYYISTKVTSSDDEFRGTTALRRATNIVCYDPVMAFYILVLVGFIAWLFFGIAWSVSGSMNDSCPEEDTVMNSVRAAIALGFSFLVGGFFALLVSFCCAGCDRRTFGGGESQGNSSNQALTQALVSDAPPPSAVIVEPQIPVVVATLVDDSKASGKENYKPPPASAPAFIGDEV